MAKKKEFVEGVDYAITIRKRNLHLDKISKEVVEKAIKEMTPNKKNK